MKIGKTIKVKPLAIKTVNFDELRMEAFSTEGKYQINDENKKHIYSFRKFRDRNLLHKGQPPPSFCTYISQQAWDDFMTVAMAAYQNKKHEACGVMIGKYFADQYGKFTVATYFIQGTGNSTSASLCEISYEDNAYIDMACKQTDSLQVIWIHSHPGYGIFYSGQDNNTLRKKYFADFHLGIVVDSVHFEYGAFKMINNNVKRWDKVFLFHEGCDEIFLPFKASDEILNQIDEANKQLALNLIHEEQKEAIQNGDIEKEHEEEIEIVHDENQDGEIDLKANILQKNTSNDSVEDLSEVIEVDERIQIEDVKEQVTKEDNESLDKKDEDSNSEQRKEASIVSKHVSIKSEEEGAIYSDSTGSITEHDPGRIDEDQESLIISNKKKEETINMLLFQNLTKLTIVLQILTHILLGVFFYIILSLLT